MQLGAELCSEEQWRSVQYSAVKSSIVHDSAEQCSDSKIKKDVGKDVGDTQCNLQCGWKLVAYSVQFGL